MDEKNSFFQGERRGFQENPRQPDCVLSVHGVRPHGHSKNWMIDRPNWQSRNGGVETMAMPQRDNVIEEIKRLDALLEYAVQHDDEAEVERLREELKRLTVSI